MGKFINPFSDWGFKHIFGQDINKEIMIAFLNSLFEGEHVISDLTFLNTEQQPETRDSRCIIYDIYCTTDDGRHIIVEMQNRNQPFFIERTVYYAARAISTQGERGYGWDYDIDAVYAIFFMNFTTKSLEPKFRSDFLLSDRDTHRPLTDKLRLVYLQMPLFKTGEHECDSLFDCWIYTLQNMEILDRMPFLARDAVFRKLAEVGDISTLSREDRIKYDSSIKRIRDTLAVYRGAVQEGMEKGMTQGIQKGMAQGVAQGVADTLRKFIANGMSVEQVAATMGMSVEKVRSITQ